MHFEEINVIPKYPSSLFIQWRLNNSSLPEDYFYDIYLSNSPKGVYVKVNASPIVNTYFYEHPIPLLTKEEYYWVKIIVKAGDETAESTHQGLFYNLEPRQYLIVKEIIRKKDLLRRKKVGVLKTYVFKRITFGAPCPDCIDIHTMLPTNSKCLGCYGTGKLNGYHPPIESLVEIVEGPRQIGPSEIGTIETRVAAADLAYPIVQKGDIIVEVDRNRRWYIDRVNKRQALQTVPVDQSVDVAQISPNDIEYSLPLPEVST